MSSDGPTPFRRGGVGLTCRRSCYAQRLSLRGRAVAVVVRDFPETPHQTRNNTDFPRPLRKGEARLRLACPPLARRNGAPHERGAGGESDPPFFPAGAPRAREKVSALCPPFGEVALSTVIPEGRESKVKERSLTVPAGNRVKRLGDECPETDHLRDVIEAALGACGPEPGGGGLCPLGRFRAAPCPDGRRGAIPSPRIGGGFQAPIEKSPVDLAGGMESSRGTGSLRRKLT